MTHRLLALLALLVAVPIASAIGCSGKSSNTNPQPTVDSGQPAVEAGPAPCDPKNCLPGNQCIDNGDGTGAQCRLVCTSQDGCPFNYHCTPTSDGSKDYCAGDKTSYTDGKGVWGAPCPPSGGVDHNMACDLSQNFWCYGQTPTDANSICTQFYCNDDTDCKGGWWCATVNQAPNVVTPLRSMGSTYTVCKPRQYCATCATDVDCLPVSGVPAHCIADKNSGGYCAPECHENSNCNNEAQCVLGDQSGLCPKTDAGGPPCVCAARARECVGDGKLCAPCRSDKDCPMGYCLQADYSSELFCSVKSPTNCAMGNPQCPKPNEAGVPGGCVSMAFGTVPADQCVGLTTFGTDPQTNMPIYVLGCYTPNR